MASFELAVATTLKHEGGYNYDPQSGEVVNHGITLKFLRGVGLLKTTGPTLQSDIEFVKSLTTEEAMEIYHVYFWTSCNLDEINDQDLAAKVFDLQVNTDRGVMFLQRAINILKAGAMSLIVDGQLGPKTQTAANSCIAATLLGKCSTPTILGYGVRREAERYYQGLAVSNPIYTSKLTGWLARLAS